MNHQEADHNVDPEQLSPLSRRVLQLREAVLEEWIQRVRQDIKSAGDLSHPILVNTFPALYDNIAELLTPDFPRKTATDGTTIAAEHGGERARLTRYDPAAIIQEYQLLRWTLIDVLRRNSIALTEDEARAVNTSIDNSIRESVTAFSLVYTALREQFVAALTHDLRNPLAAASAAAELIMHTSDRQQVETLAGKIITHHRRMSRMLEDLLDVMVFQGGERAHLSLSQFDLLELMQEVQDAAIAAHGPRFRLGGSSVSGWWGREALKRALENLIGNAVKYGSADTPIDLRINTANQRVILTVRNQGEPVPPEKIESIFQLFRRADTRSKGWGIGLPYVRSVAESHGGSIGVDSTTDRGTAFFIDIPVDARPFQNAPLVTTPGLSKR